MVLLLTLPHQYLNEVHFVFLSFFRTPSLSALEFLRLPSHPFTRGLLHRLDELGKAFRPPPPPTPVKTRNRCPRLHFAPLLLTDGRPSQNSLSRFFPPPTPF